MVKRRVKKKTNKPLIKNINKNNNIINIKINPIQQTNRRRRRRKQLNKSLNKKSVDNVQGYYAKNNTNMKPSSYFSRDNAFQRTKDLLLQDERTKGLIENKTKYSQLEDRKGNKALTYKDALRTKIDLLEDKKKKTHTKPLTEEDITTTKKVSPFSPLIKNNPEYDDYKSDNPYVHIESESDEDSDEDSDEEDKDDKLDVLLDDLSRNYHSKKDVRDKIKSLYIDDLRRLYFKYNGKNTNMNKKKLRQKIIDKFGKDLRKSK